jgi:hypothetical protein
MLHASIVLTFAFVGFLFGLSVMTTALGAVAGLIIAAALYFLWGKSAIAANSSM